MPEIHFRQPGFTYSACGPFTKEMKKEYKNLKKQEIHDIFIRTKEIKPIFSITLLIKVERFN